MYRVMVSLPSRARSRRVSLGVESLRSQGEDIDKETLSHVSLLPFKHVVPNGTYFIEDV